LATAKPRAEPEAEAEADSKHFDTNGAFYTRGDDGVKIELVLARWRYERFFAENNQIEIKTESKDSRPDI
jgi:hypothetical protein